MKKYYPKFDRGCQTKALSLLVGLILCPLAGMATDSIYVNNGTINNANIPQIDATNFYNSGSWNIRTDPSGVGLPYQTAHTLNYTNIGTMVGSPGWEFDYGPLPPNGGRGMSANFVNNSASASIQAVNGQVGNPNTGGNTIFNLDYLWISATNIVNKGMLQADAYGEIRLTGTNVNLSRSTVEIVPVSGTGSSNTRTNFAADVAVYDEYWGQDTTNLDSLAVWNGAIAASATLPTVDVTMKCSSVITVNGGFLSFVPTLADSTNIMGGSITVTLTNFIDNLESITITTNIIHQAVFVTKNDANIIAAIGFTPSASPTNFFRTATVRLLNSVSGGALYLVDTLASASGRGVLPNSVTSPLDECGAVTFRPTNYIVSRTLSGSFGSPGQGTPPANFLFDASWGSQVVVGAAYAAYSFLVDNGVSGQPIQRNPSFTNAQGRVFIKAGVLNLDHAQILQPAGPGVQGDGALFIQANQVLNSQNAIITFRNVSLNIGSTNGTLNVTNFASAASLSSGLNGTVSAWSAVWTNQAFVVVTNYSFDTNRALIGTQLLTNTVQINLHAFLVDARQLKSSSPVTVHDLVLHSTNIIVSDPMTVANSFLLDGQAVTLLTNLTLSGLIQDWTSANAPNLLYFTNYGTLTIPNNAHFGDDRAVPYVEFVNKGIINSAGQTIDSLDFQIVNGRCRTTRGDFSATANSIKITGPPPSGFIYSINSSGDINLSANTLLIDPAALNASGAVNFNVTTNLSDNDVPGNSIVCNNGFNLWTKPKFGDLLGSTVTSIASGNFAEVDSAWAGTDWGSDVRGYSNNVAIGTLVLSPQNFTGTQYPLFYFYGTGPGSNAMYVVTLDLSQLTSADEVAQMIQVASNMKIYFSHVIFPLGFTTPGGQTQVEFLQNTFPGQFINVPNVVISRSGSVNWNTVYQQIDGFGASSAFSGRVWSDATADAFFSTNTGIGLSLLRNFITTSVTETASELGLMQKAQARGARLWSTPWSPPAAYKSNGNDVGGNFVAANYQAYASRLANYVKTNADAGVIIYALSIQNEPDANVGYVSCHWTPQQFHDFVPFLRSALVASNVASTKIMLPESQNWTDPQGLAATTLNDSSTAADVDIIANHNYGADNENGDQNPPAVVPTYGKALWETEVATFNATNGSIANGIYWAGRIHAFLTVAQANAWHYWWLISLNNDNEGLELPGDIPTKRMYAVGQYSRFVRPGYYRVGVNTTSGALLVTAFKDTNSPNFAIVAVNPSDSIAVNQTFNLTNFPAAGFVTPWITSSNLSLTNLSTVLVSNLSFTYTIPVQSVVTFVGQAITNMPSLRLALQSVASQTINAGVTFVGTNTATDPNTPAPELTFNLLGGPTNATLATNGIFTWRPLVSQANTTNAITVKVAENGLPGQSATSGFTLIVNPLSRPTLNSIVSSGGQIILTAKGPTGPDYTLWTSTNLVTWQVLSTTNSPTTPLTLTVTNRNERMRFYRLQLGP